MASQKGVHVSLGKRKGSSLSTQYPPWQVAQKACKQPSHVIFYSGVVSDLENNGGVSPLEPLI